MTHPQVDARGFTLIELVIVTGLIGVLVATAVPSLFRARIAANEAFAIGSIRTIVGAQQDFSALTQGFADDLATLATPCPGGSTPFVSTALGANGIEKGGFEFTLAAGAGAVAVRNDCFGNVTLTAFYATAVPVTVGFSGTRAFAANNTGVIWQDTLGAAPPEPFVLTPTRSPLAR